MQHVLVHEVGPRDGLQIEKQVVPFELKVRWIEGLVAAGLDMVQIGSFVHKEKVPQMADTDRLFEYFSSPEHTPASCRLTGLVLNEKGLERGLSVGVQYFCMGASASDTHSRKNTGMSTEEATTRIIAMGQKALQAGKGVQVSVQSAFGCGFEGAIPEERVLGMVRRFVDAGLRTISLADTAGHAHPAQVERMFSAVLELAPDVECAAHLHNTYGLGMANAYAAVRAGVKVVETAFGGLGGCPFTAVTGGNVATEDFVHMLHRMGIRQDIRLDAIVEATKNAGQFLGRELPAFIARTGPVPGAQTSQG